MIKKIVPILVLFSLLLSACASAQMSASEEGIRDYANSGAAPAAAPEYDGKGLDTAYQTDESAASVERIVIKTANMTIVVASPAAAMKAIGEMAEKMGGYIVSSYLYQETLDSGEEVPRASITVRVPSERLTEALETIKSGAGEVRREDVYGQDVTRDYTDLQSRLRNLEDAEARLREILGSATKTEDVLNVHYQLTQVREQIEVLKGQIQYYEQSAALSAISVEIIADKAVQPLSIGGWEPVGTARDALQSLIDTLRFLLKFAIWLVIYIIPVLAIILLPVYFIVRGIRRLRRRSKPAPQAEPTEQQ